MRSGKHALVIFSNRISTGDLCISPAVFVLDEGDTVAAYIKESAHRMLSNNALTSCARFIGECHQKMPGNHYLWVVSLPVTWSAARHELWDALREHRALFQNGIYLVNLTQGRVFHYKWDDSEELNSEPEIIGSFIIRIPEDPDEQNQDGGDAGKIEVAAG